MFEVVCLEQRHLPSGLSACPRILISLAMSCCIKLSKRGSTAVNVILNVIFDVLLTVLLSVFISVFNQLDVQNLFYSKFYFMPLHVSSTCAHHQEVKIALHSLWYHHMYRSDDTRGCVIQFCLPDDEHMHSKHIEARNKLIVKQKFCASWLITEINIKCSVRINAKETVYCAIRCEYLYT